uniref:Alpha-L-fucosidase C-terminal domain-containing protein n=1 Tax=Arion vulgaris TaxID=1028688 RepID=A0A0B7B5Z4_9EUPU
MGSWLQVNGEAVYKSRPWTYQNDTVTSGVWYTQQENAEISPDKNIFAFVFTWPEETLTLGSPLASSRTQISLLGYKGQFTFNNRPSGGLIINIPAIAFNKMPCEWLWVFKISNPMN